MFANCPKCSCSGFNWNHEKRTHYPNFSIPSLVSHCFQKTVGNSMKYLQSYKMTTCTYAAAASGGGACGQIKGLLPPQVCRSVLLMLYGVDWHCLTLLHHMWAGDDVSQTVVQFSTASDKTLLAQHQSYIATPIYCHSDPSGSPRMDLNH